MRRKIFLAVCLAVVAGVAGRYQYLEWSEQKRAQGAADYANQLQQRALQEPDKLVDEAKDLIDNWAGSGDDLRKAEGNLRYVLNAHPNHVKARIERARVVLNTGYISYRQFQPGTLDKSEAQLQDTLKIDPNAADVYVLMAHIQTMRGLSEKSLQTLAKAEQLGTANPWLYLNWVRALLDLNRPAEAETRLAQARERLSAINPSPKRIWARLHEHAAWVMSAQDKFEEADKAYQALIATDPDYAWGRGNYAAYLLFVRGMPDAAIEQAESALKIMDYGIGRLMLTSALYAKWAEVKQHSPEQAEPYLLRAKSLSPNLQWMMAKAASSVGNAPVLLTLVKELMALGVPLDVKDEHEDTGLTLAAFTGDTKSVELLIKLGADIESRDNLDRTALACAALKGHVDTIRLLAANRANINTLDRMKLTPLHVAAATNNFNTVRALLELKADINNAAPDFTPLMQAAQLGHQDMVSLLLEAGADPAIRTVQKQQTAADLAMAAGFSAVSESIQEAERQRARRKR